MDLFALPYPAVMALLVAAFVIPACGLHALLRRSVSYDKLVDHNDVAGFMISLVGVLYAVLIAFVVVVVWQQYNESDANYAREVSTVADVFAEARTLDTGDRAAIQSLAARYERLMVGEEWPAMRDGTSSPRVDAMLAALSAAVVRVTPRTPAVVDSRSRLLEAVQRLADLREHRLADNVSSLPPVLWVTLICGAIITIGFGYLFGVGNVRVHLLMTGAVATMIALSFTLLIELDYPFRRDSAISDARWLRLEPTLRSAPRVSGRPRTARERTA